MFEPNLNTFKDLIKFIFILKIPLFGSPSYRYNPKEEYDPLWVTTLKAVISFLEAPDYIKTIFIYIVLESVWSGIAFSPSNDLVSTLKIFVKAPKEFKRKYYQL